MQEWIVNYLSEYRAEFFLAQMVTVLSLFLLGLLFVWLSGKNWNMTGMLIAYPAGLSLYVLAGMLLLVGDLGFTVSHILIVLAVFLVLTGFFGYRRIGIRGLWGGKKVSWELQKKLLMVLGAVLLIALISCSGILPVSLSNDSMYYYSLYPRALATYGELRRQFNVFLTDVGPGSALIGTLPYFFGFNETFGIQWAFNINFLIFYAYMMKRRTDSLAAALLSLLLLGTAMPFFILSKWAMSNFYFMEYLMFCILTARELLDNRAESLPGQEPENGPEGGRNVSGILVLSVLTVMLSTLRMEGMVFTLFLVFAYSLLPGANTEMKAESKTAIKTNSVCSRLANQILLPCLVLHGLYFYRIFVQMEIIAAYTFLSKGKAVLELAAMVLLFVFLISKVKITKMENVEFTGKNRNLADTIRKMIGYLRDREMEVVLIMLTLVNFILLLMDRSLYFENLKAFGRNLFHRSGWGVFPFVVCGVILLIALCLVLDRKKYTLSYMDFLVLGYLLITLAVSFARGDPMQESFGDSGNRVLMQIAPLLTYALCERLFGILNSNSQGKMI